MGFFVVINPVALDDTLFLVLRMMIEFTATLQKFASQGEKTGWTYISLPLKVSHKLNPGIKKSYRVKGRIDDHEIKAVATVPMGEGAFIIAVNATMRKAIRKQQGDKVTVKLEPDNTAIVLNAALIKCLKDEPLAMENFNALPLSHRRYYSRWIESAKTESTRTKRIAIAVDTLAKKMNYGEMIRSQKNEPL